LAWEKRKEKRRAGANWERAGRQPSFLSCQDGELKGVWGQGDKENLVHISTCRWEGEVWQEVERKKKNDGREKENRKGPGGLRLPGSGGAWVGRDEEQGTGAEKLKRGEGGL